MITERDLAEAIAECQGKRTPDASTCIKLAAFYTIREHLYPTATYSYAPAPETVIHIDSKSEFADAVEGKSPGKVWAVMDELMSTLEIIQPRLYAAVMEKLY